MATTIEQYPLYTLLPVGQEVIFSVSNAPIVSNYTKVKIIAEVYISDAPIVPSSETPVGTFKTTPNNAGVGMFDFRPIIENYVKSDNTGNNQSTYKGVTNILNPFPIHLIDEYCRNTDAVRYLAIEFKTEYLDTATNSIVLDDSQDISEQYTLFNGYLKHTDKINVFESNFGFNTQIFDLSDAVGRYLTNAPTTQYATKNDYGTLGFYAKGNTELSYITFTYTKTDGTTQLQSVNRNWSNGAYSGAASWARLQILYFGCFPANIRNWSSSFRALIDAGTLESYTIQAFNIGNQPILETITINLLCPTLKGYEPIRLTWLNQWGVWDYYTFNMKSTKSISTKGSTYQQLEGTWNESIYLPNGYKGGKKAFRVNAMEKISMNTDFVNESESEWFEELINSPEVYILEGYQEDSTLGVIYSSLHTYATPVRLTTSNYTKKTVANDKLMQYTFEVEKSKTLRTQSV